MENSRDKKILLIGGHMTPALAILEELQSRGFHNFVWVGNKFSQTQSSNLSAEYVLITNKKIKFINFSGGKLWRRWTFATLFKAIYNLILIPLGFINSAIIILVEQPDLVISFGGYLALPLVISTKLFAKKAVTHEQTLSAGIANGLIGKFADKIFVSWEKSLEDFPKNKAIFSGNPIRKDVLVSTTDKINFPDKLPLIYITGGNQGANTINWRLYKVLPQLLAKANIIHQVGNSSITNDFEKAKQAFSELPENLKPRYQFFDNILGPEIGEIFAKSDLIVSRCGANTISEILALGKRAILIPIPWSSHNEQLLNARLVAETGLAWILQQYDAMPPQELETAIINGLNLVNTEHSFLVETNYAQAKAAGLNLVKLDAAKIMVDQCEKLIV
jgi:UDP-N-acetylglucosamine--N-acetylmuramyl-(pentapeptide) pyrophosphoryl-undecaprenol N-acetylglucosamine transferase